MRKLFSVLTLIVALAPGLALSQQAEQPAQLGTRGAGEDARNPNVMRLSLDEAIATAVERNLGVELLRYDYRMSGYAARSAYGLFDWYGFGQVSTASTEQPVTSVIFSPQSDRTLFNVGVQQTLPIGGTYSLSLNNSRVSSNNPFTTVDPAFSSDVGFSLNQPLLRDFGVDVTRRTINIARNNLGISEAAFRNVMMLTVLGVEQAYYDLIYARQNLEVVQQSLSLATDQERITQIRIDVGASAPLDILQPRVAIATREEEVIIAEAAIRTAEDRLRRLMNLPASEWGRPMVPADPIQYRPVEVDLEASVARAMELRPEIKQASLGVDNREIEFLYARNQVLPELDFQLEYGFAGLGGDRLLRDDEGNQIGVVEGGFGDAFEQVYGFDFPSWTVGFNVGVPISNIGARAERKRAELSLSRSRQFADQVRQDIAIEVRQAVRDIDTAARRIVAARAAREAAEKNLDAERRRFENGMTTNFQVLEVQQDLASARSRELLALVEYNKAVAAYHQAVGDILETHDISVGEPEQFEIRKGSFENVRWLNYRGYVD